MFRSFRALKEVTKAVLTARTRCVSVNMCMCASMHVNVMVC